MIRTAFQKYGPKYGPLILLILVFESISGFIGFATAPSDSQWYTSLIKSPLTPPGWVFGVVWPTLYLMMAISVWLIWQKRKSIPVAPLLVFFAVHMILNWSWNFVFFEWQLLGLAFGLLIIIVLCVTSLIILFRKVNEVAAALLVPYLVWVCFASYLSGYIWYLN